MFRLLVLIIYLVSCAITVAHDKSWEDLARNSKYVVIFDVGTGKEFKWIPVGDVKILKGKARDTGSYFLNISKSGKMIIIGTDFEEEFLVISNDGIIINQTSDGKIVKISVDAFIKIVSQTEK